MPNLKSNFFLNFKKYRYFIALFTILLAILFFITKLLPINFLTVNFTEIYSLSPEQVFALVWDNEEVCHSLKDCELKSGDILIRRYVTERTKIFDYLVNPYFNHSAFYLGEGKIVEAVGNERNKQNEIQIADFYNSDWINEDIESFVIIRPDYEVDELAKVIKSLIDIADDPEYEFGLSEEGKKRTTCAELIFFEIHKVGLLKIDNIPQIITPDYLYNVTVTNKEKFKIVGYAWLK